MYVQVHYTTCETYMCGGGGGVGGSSLLKVQSGAKLALTILLTSPLLVSLSLIIQSHIACHLSMRSLTSIITCIITFSRSTRTLHHRITIHTSLRRML